MKRTGGALRILLVAVIVLLAGCAGAVPGDPTPAESGSNTDSTAETANGTVAVHYINVGQSVSTLVVGPEGETMLVDTGHYDDDGEHVLRYLRRHDVTRIDHLVTSHNDADHIGGNAAVIDYFETEVDGIGAIYDPGIAASTQTYDEYLDAVEEHDVTLYETREGDAIQFGEVDVDVLGPPEPYLENEGRNENSIVLRLAHGETSFLLTGDAEDDQEAYLIDAYGAELESTVLKAGHHGSASSSSEPFLDAVQPRAVVVSSAYDSQYGHPHEEVLQRLSDRSIPTYWTATHGDTVLVSDGSGVSVQTQRDAPTDPLALREGDPVAPGTSGGVVERARLGGGAEDGGETDETDETDDADDADDADEENETGSTEPSAAVEVAAINADAEGDDRENLNDEYVVFENAGDEPIDLSGWTVEDEAARSYEFPEGFTLGAGATVTLRTGSGADTDAELYWGSGSPVWNNDGDTVILSTPDGERVLEVSYE
ncbi:lamin tail domain-containing protein [Halorubrum sp. CSM-61]|uniref:lamin tail domain-containing protein n=1 Tax=Halorubrum sp. CSM-61 TaxID=2485838 RepID=UPI000F4B7B5C|nr:lamin tail domain-containing protein [Halorubrum sp. CSM-61]